MIDDYDVIYSDNSNELIKKVKALIDYGWQPLGSMQIVMVEKFDKDSISQYGSMTQEFYQTIVKGSK